MSLGSDDIAGLPVDELDRKRDEIFVWWRPLWVFVSVSLPGCPKVDTFRVDFFHNFVVFVNQNAPKWKTLVEETHKAISIKHVVARCKVFYHDVKFLLVIFKMRDVAVIVLVINSYIISRYLRRDTCLSHWQMVSDADPGLILRDFEYFCCLSSALALSPVFQKGGHLGHCRG